MFEKTESFSKSRALRDLIVLYNGSYDIIKEDSK
jgi:hypothetical protein